MNINIWAVIIAIIAQFIIGAAWYSLLFGTIWGKIHGYDKLDADTQKEMASKMGPLYGVQLIFTIISTIALAVLIGVVHDYSPYTLALLVWIGFIVPAQVSAALFGGTDHKWLVTKPAIQAGGSLAGLLAAVAILNAFN